MGKIVICAQGEATVGLLAGLRKATNHPMGSLRNALTAGSVLLERRVFGNDHDEAALDILGVVDCLEHHGVHYQLYELAASQDFDDVPRDRCRIALGVLKNALAR